MSSLGLSITKVYYLAIYPGDAISVLVSVRRCRHYFSSSFLGDLHIVITVNPKGFWGGEDSTNKPK